MHGHLGLSSGSCASLSRASGTSASHLVSNATTASATPATAAATSFKSSGVGQSSSAARYSNFVAGGSGARGGGAGETAESTFDDAWCQARSTYQRG